MLWARVEDAVGMNVLPVWAAREQFRVSELGIAPGGIGTAQVRLVNYASAPGATIFCFLARPAVPAVLFDSSRVPQQIAKYFSGIKILTFEDDFYNRIHWNPHRIDFGQVTSPQIAFIKIWNAWRSPRALVGIAGQVAGLSVDAPSVFSGLSENVVTLHVTPTGTDVNTLLTLIFDNGNTVVIHVQAKSVAIAWFFMPDWAHGIRERLAWATDVLRSETLVEQRRALRIAPRRTFELNFIVSGRERQRLELALTRNGAKVWIAPVWYDLQHIGVSLHAGELAIPCRTEGGAFRNEGTALLISQDTREVINVAAVSPTGITLATPLSHDWPAGTRFYPGMFVQLAGEPALERLSDSIYTFSATFANTEPFDVAPAPPTTTYRERPILTQRPNEAETLTRQFTRLLATLDSGLAAAAQVTDVGRRALPVLAWRWIGKGRDERHRYRAFLYWLAGRRRALWVPSWADDLTLVAPVTATALDIDITACDYSQNGFDRPGRRDIRIELRDGNVFHRRITAAYVLPDTDTERLTLDAPFGRALIPDDVVLISWLILARSEQDEIEIEHITDAEGVARSEIVFQAVRDDEF